ncbi:Bdr family repetitive protein [Borrelia sp. P9F1]|uniref:Bdr family repetitive protein n=1 Tax=Borrelia sp. P9F1 TaxID=3058374 RepID=UPI00264A1D42|nr:Bdr family repetitive protein [Borrelia sp. P9F1]WKC58483.1 Bdr family repetitive protein [Borrelia sp. P9F1]
MLVQVRSSEANNAAQQMVFDELIRMGMKEVAAAEVARGYFYKELDTKIDNLEDKLNTKIDSFKNEINTKIDTLEIKFNAKFNLHNWMITFLITTNIAILLAVLFK